jgi:nucleotide-binding universal stress UspA family protein
MGPLGVPFLLHRGFKEVGVRSILITLDKTPSCVAARTFAVALSRRTGAALKGVTAVDVSDLEGVEVAPIGGIEHAYDRMKHRQQQAELRRSAAAGMPHEFQRACSIDGVRSQFAALEGDIKGELLQLIETVDLVLTGRDAQFHFEPSDGVAPLVEFIVAQGSRPALVTGPSFSEQGSVLVAYDGSRPAAKSLQLAVLLGMFAGRTAHVVSIHKEADPARTMAARAASYLSTHDIDARAEPLASSADPADLLMGYAEKIGACLLVMGAFGHRGLREMLFGSCTRRLYDSASVPLFIHH